MLSHYALIAKSILGFYFAPYPDEFDPMLLFSQPFISSPYYIVSQNEDLIW
jgi:hypothetical protein